MSSSGVNSNSENSFIWNLKDDDLNRLTENPSGLKDWWTRRKISNLNPESIMREIDKLDPNDPKLGKKLERLNQVKEFFITKTTNKEKGLGYKITKIFRNAQGKAALDKAIAKKAAAQGDKWDYGKWLEKSVKKVDAQIGKILRNQETISLLDNQIHSLSLLKKYNKFSEEISKLEVEINQLKEQQKKVQGEQLSEIETNIILLEQQKNHIINLRTAELTRLQRTSDAVGNRLLLGAQYVQDERNLPKYKANLSALYNRISMISKTHGQSLASISQLEARIEKENTEKISRLQEEYDNFFVEVVSSGNQDYIEARILDKIGNIPKNLHLERAVFALAVKKFSIKYNIYFTNNELVKEIGVLSTNLDNILSGKSTIGLADKIIAERYFKILRQENEDYFKDLSIMKDLERMKIALLAKANSVSKQSQFEQAVFILVYKDYVAKNPAIFAIAFDVSPEMVQFNEPVDKALVSTNGRGQEIIAAAARKQMHDHLHNLPKLKFSGTLANDYLKTLTLPTARGQTFESEEANQISKDMSRVTHTLFAVSAGKKMHLFEGDNDAYSQSRVRFGVEQVAINKEAISLHSSPADFLNEVDKSIEHRVEPVAGQISHELENIASLSMQNAQGALSTIAGIASYGNRGVGVDTQLATYRESDGNPLNVRVKDSNNKFTPHPLHKSAVTKIENNKVVMQVTQCFNRLEADVERENGLIKRDGFGAAVDGFRTVGYQVGVHTVSFPKEMLDLIQNKPNPIIESSLKPSDQLVIRSKLGIKEGITVTRDHIREYNQKIWQEFSDKWDKATDQYKDQVEVTIEWSELYMPPETEGVYTSPETEELESETLVEHSMSKSKAEGYREALGKADAFHRNKINEFLGLKQSEPSAKEKEGEVNTGDL